jgi:hypothetical protein
MALLLALDSLKNFKTHIRSRPREVLPSVNKPLDGTNNDDDRKCNNAII